CAHPSLSSGRRTGPPGSARARHPLLAAAAPPDCHLPGPVTVADKNRSRPARWLGWLWPLGLLLIAWLIAPLRAGRTYPGMPCTAQADTVFSLASYTVLFIPTAGVLLWLSRRLIPTALRRGLRAWAAGLTAVAIGIGVVFLAFAGVSADRRPFRTSEQAVNCPNLGAGQTHRVGFYRYSTRQSPPVDAFFLRDVAGNGETGYEVIDFLHGQAMFAYVRPADLQPDESAYLDRVTAGVATLNQDLDQATQSPSPPGVLAAMRTDFQRITGELASAPKRLSDYRDGRVKRFLENYDLILTAEESAAGGQSGQAIHASAFEDHRRFYYQEARVA